MSENRDHRAYEHASSRQSSADHPAFDRLEKLLDGPAESPWLFGVCGNLARRNDWPVWAVRAVMLLALIVLTLPTLLVYLTFGLAMEETNARTRRMLRQGAIAVLKGIRSLINRMQGKPAQSYADY